MGSMNKCDWCGALTSNKECYSAMSPLNEKYEKLIQQWDKDYGQFWYDNVEGEIDQKLLDEVILYEQATSTVGKAIICNDCHEKDEILYQKYRQLTVKGEGDPFGMLKIVVDNDDNVDYDIDKMEMWYDDVKNKQNSLEE
jgi:hypothetical protein